MDFDVLINIIVVIWTIAFIAFVVFLNKHANKKRHTGKPSKTYKHLTRVNDNNVKSYFNDFVITISNSYKKSFIDKGLLIHSLDLENEFIKLCYYCLMNEVSRNFNNSAITNKFSDLYWRAAHLKGFEYEIGYTSVAKQHFSSLENLKSENEEKGKYFTVFCEKAFYVYKLKDGKFNESIVMPILLSESRALYENVRKEISDIYQALLVYFVSTLTIQEKVIHLHRHGITFGSPYQNENTTVEKNKDKSNVEKTIENSLLLKIGISIGEASSKSKVHTNLYTKLDFTIYIFFNLYIAFANALENEETCLKIEENFRNAFMEFSTEKLGIDKDFACEFYYNRLSMYNDIMISESTNKDDALMVSLEQFIQKDIQKDYFSKNLIVCDITESINDTLSYTLLYEKVMEDITPTFNRIIEFYK